MYFVGSWQSVTSFEDPVRITAGLACELFANPIYMDGADPPFERHLKNICLNFLRAQSELVVTHN
jgi:hypothetical protein